MTAVTFNPYTWDNSSKAIQSSVISLELQSGKAKINVSDLEDDIVMVIPISNPQKNITNTSEVPEHSFLKPGKLSFRSYHAELADVPVSVEMSVTEECTIELFVKFGSRPSVDNSDLNFNITFKSTCENQTHGQRNETSCVLEASIVKVVPSKTGTMYVGILYLGAKDTTEHSRKRRSCFGHGRQRRSCVGFKDPPPKGVTKTVVPQYDPSTDLNYTMTITQSSCLYWSKDKDKWTSDGCKVTNLRHYYAQVQNCASGTQLSLTLPLFQCCFATWTMSKTLANNIERGRG